MMDVTTAVSDVRGQLLTRLQTFLDDSKLSIDWNKFENEGNYINPTARVNDLAGQGVDVTHVFNVEHHWRSALEMFTQLHQRHRWVVFGHKNHGKSQFLFFLVQFLKSCGELVLYLDKSILPKKGKELYNVSFDTCVQYWKKDFDNIAEVKKQLQKFLSERTQSSFADSFLTALEEFAKNNRVWIIVDEVTSFEDIMPLPEEQEKSPFHWVITGSVGLSSFVAKQHLKRWVFNLPRFTSQESADFALKLSKELQVKHEDLLDAFGVKWDSTQTTTMTTTTAATTSSDASGSARKRLGDVLEEFFGGIPGYIAECLLGLSKGEAVSDYTGELYERIGSVILKAAKERGVLVEGLARDWLKEFKDPVIPWLSLRDSGLCGTDGPPRGVIFTSVLRRLFLHNTDNDENLAAIRHFRSKYGRDAGLDGCLLELEEITKLRSGQRLQTIRVSLKAGNWQHDNGIHVLYDSQFTMFRYDERQQIIVESANEPLTKHQWHLVEVAVGFPVVDIVLVSTADANILQVYAIQITRSTDPFNAHSTTETCSDKSKTRLKNLFVAIDDQFHATKRHVMFVMLAPNCEKGKHVAHDQTEPYLVSPPSIVTTQGKRMAETSAGAPPRSKKTRESCCACKSGSCKGCKCGNNHKRCTNCSSRFCENQS